MAVKVLEGKQKITGFQVDALFGTTHDVSIAKSILYQDAGTAIVDYVSGGTEIPLTKLRLDNGNIGINLEKSLGAKLEYNRIYFMNATDEELVCLKIEPKDESEINNDIEIQIGQGDAVTVIAT